jgi:hypothetical protein
VEIAIEKIKSGIPITNPKSVMLLGFFLSKTTYSQSQKLSLAFI